MRLRPRGGLQGRLPSWAPQPMRKKQVTRARGPGSLSATTARRFPLVLRWPKGTRTRLPTWPSVALTDESPFEDPNPPSLILEVRRRPKGAAVVPLSVSLGSGLPHRQGSIGQSLPE